MTEETIRKLLGEVRSGARSIDEAVSALRAMPFEDLGFAKVDHHRNIRCGFPEVVFGQGKTVEQIASIFARCAAQGGNVMVTRLERAAFDAIAPLFPKAQFHEQARMITLRQKPARLSEGGVTIVSAGTSDLRVAEEARVTAEMMDQQVRMIHDVGVAGIHRLLAHARELQSASVIIVVAGMDGALPSVVGGLVDCPVIAVPTSVGYGASFDGLAALLTMLNSCASGVTVVNIDNGFGAGFAAAAMLRRMYPSSS